MLKRNGTELTTSIITLVLAAAAAVLFCLSYTTGYYIFGQMNSGLIALLLGAGIAVGLITILLRRKFADKFWPLLLTYAVTALLAAAAMVLLGDRVEGIGNCIVTDYDSGHGGEEAIYMSLAAVILLVCGVIYNIIGSFAQDKTEEPTKNQKIVRTSLWGVTALAVLLGVLIPTGGLVRGNTGSSAVGAGGADSGAGSYTVTYNGNEGNLDSVPDYQFLCSDFSGFLAFDNRMYIGITLELDGNGGYDLFSEAYVIENGKRAEIGDDTGLGQNLNMSAQGAYADNGDGTVTIRQPEHAVFTMEMDTYSAQMKEAAGMNVDGHTDDGVYDSGEYPTVLDFVPETVFTLRDGEIVKYRDASAGGAYTISYNVNNGNAEEMPDYQFLCSDFSGMVNADSRFYVDETLELDGSNYTLSVDAYVVENGERAVIGDDTGLGLVLTMNATGSYTDNGDGTYTTSMPDHAVFEMETDTYSSQMKGAAQMNVNGNEEDGVYDSNDEPAVLDFVPETVWTLSGGEIVSYFNPAEESEAGEPSEEAASGEATAETGVTFPSDDEATTLTFYPDGSYRFYFAAYDIEDLGAYSYEDGVLTITDANGAETTAEGDPLVFTYAYSMSDQLTGSFTIAAADLTFESAAGEEADNVFPSDDGATTMTFLDDGTYVFAFEAYGIEDAGTYTFAGGVLTVTNVNGDEVTAEGDPLTFHYVSGVSDQLTGDFTIPANALEE